MLLLHKSEEIHSEKLKRMIRDTKSNDVAMTNYSSIPQCSFNHATLTN